MPHWWRDELIRIASGPCNRPSSICGDSSICLLFSGRSMPLAGPTPVQGDTMRAIRMRIGAAIGIAVLAIACGNRQAEQDPSISSDDALFVTLKERFGVAPSAV